MCRTIAEAFVQAAVFLWQPSGRGEELLSPTTSEANEANPAAAKEASEARPAAAAQEASEAKPAAAKEVLVTEAKAVEAVGATPVPPLPPLPLPLEHREGRPADALTVEGIVWGGWSTRKDSVRRGKLLQDGGGLCSPGRWALEQRRFPRAAAKMTEVPDTAIRQLAGDGGEAAPRKSWSSA